MAITVHGAGCCLMDYLYRDVGFSGDRFERLLSQTPGDGGLIVGGLVFAEHLANYAGEPFDRVIGSLVGGAPDDQNVGGPAIVSLIHTAQLCPDAEVSFYGATGSDDTGRELMRMVRRTPVRVDHLRTIDGATPATFVLSDPSASGGSGERLFVNQLGVAAEPQTADPGPGFTSADIVQFGGTALCPPLHARLPELLACARSSGALTIVNTVYDFLAQNRAPDRRWTLGSDDAYPLIDLLVTDLEEARRLTECSTALDAIKWMIDHGVSAAVVTCGPDPVAFAAAGGRFAAVPLAHRSVFKGFPAHPLAEGSVGDTTGCGDNFVGGMVSDITMQIAAAAHTDRGAAIDVDRAVVRGIASGAFCLTHLGGMFREKSAGDKASRVDAIVTEYHRLFG
ncbi:MAG: carbohydrate kinase family protein [Spirochaetaceae bacterium]|nr:MAG: carbohydrate kinase family protein [Spirochaetaceae bacterium]